jgi:hypothetical protein
VPDPELEYAAAVLLRLAELDLPSDYLYGLFGRLARLPGVAYEIDVALSEIAAERQPDPDTHTP